MERILIDSQVEGYALQYEKDFRALKHDVPGDLRGWKAVLSALNIHNKLSPDELDQYQKYLEEVATDYDNADKTKNLLVLMPDEFDTYCKKYASKFPLVSMDKDLVYRIQKGGKNKGRQFKK